MKKPYIIAEIAQGYEGSRKLVELYIEAAANAGADAIKFHIFSADELAVQDYKYYDLFKSLELPYDFWEKAIQKSHDKGIAFYSDILGTDSLNALDRIGIDGYKVHTTDINNRALLQQIAATKKEILVSTGGAEPEEVEAALEILEGCNVTLLHGFQAEPTEIDDNHINRFRSIKKRFDRPLGFQDHTAGDSEMALYLPFVAMGAGVDVFEKHLTLSRTAEIEDCISALNPEEFTSWVRLMKDAYKGLGTKEWTVTEKEKIYRGKVRRAICAARDIAEGEVISEDNISLKRSDNPDALYNMNDLLNKKTNKGLLNNTVITKKDIT